MKTCSKCNISQDLTEFYFKNRAKGRLSNKCRTCESKEAGVIFIGKNKYHKELREKGLIKCSDCQNIKTKENYSLNKTANFGYVQICKECCNIRHSKYIENAKENLTDSFLKQYLKANYNLNVKDATPELLEIAELEIRIKREPKYFLDGISFVTLRDFAIYVQNNYGMGIHSTEARIRAGHTEKQCTVSESEHRSEFTSKSKGKVIVIDIETNETKIFNNRTELRYKYNISAHVITRCIENGEIRKPYKNSKNYQSLKIQKYEQI